LIQQYKQWAKVGKRHPPTAEVLVGLYSVLYLKKYKMLPITPVQDDLEAFETFLGIVKDDISIAPYCVEVLFSLKEFHMKSSAFANRRVIDKWNVIERAHKFRNSRHGIGEQAEYRSDQEGFGIVRV
jgi:hypothetical protein